MSIDAVVEVALHFESFRNIDLFHQGLYHLRTRLYREGEPGRPCAASPCGHLACLLPVPEEGAQKPNKPPRLDHHHLIPAHADEDQSSFSTRSFLIRYCEEEVELNDIGLFRVEVEAEHLDETPVLLLEVELMFADLTGYGGADRFGESPDVASAEFKCVSVQRYRLREIHTGLHEYCPLVFDEYHFCISNLVIHSSLLDVRLRLNPLAPLPVAPRPRPNEGGRGSRGAVAVAEEPGPTKPPGRDTGPTARRPESLSLAESLFQGCSSSESREQLLDRAEGLYRKHTQCIRTARQKLTKWFTEVQRDCLTPVQRQALQLTEVEDPLEHFFSGGSTSSSAPARPEGGLSKFISDRIGASVSWRSIASLLAYDLATASSQLSEEWHQALLVFLYAPREVTLFTRRAWERRIERRWSSSIIREASRHDLAVAEEVSVCEGHHLQADDVRKALASVLSEQAADLVEDISLIPQIEARPLIFEQRYGFNQGPPMGQPFCAPSEPKPYRGVHLFVLVHGFQGNSFDMRLMKNNLALLYPTAVFLSSTANEDNTEGDISEMGIRLAQEVVNYICDWCPHGALGRLSFVAHSMGGLIARAALPLLHEYSSKMWTFMTFSTSHLGLFQDRISLFNTGFWVLKQWRRCLFLSQVSMTDHENPRETFLYKLSTSPGFEFFQNILLVSCYEDQYGPFQSARAEICSDWGDQSDKQVYIEMVRNLWANVKPERLSRLDVNFVIPEKNLDTFIGRAAHIQFLECQPIMKMLLHVFSSYFR